MAKPNTNSVSYPFETMSRDQLRMLCSIGVANMDEEQFAGSAPMMQLCARDPSFAATVIASRTPDKTRNIIQNIWGESRMSNLVCAEMVIDAAINLGSLRNFRIDWTKVIGKDILSHPRILNKVVNEDDFFSVNSVGGYECDINSYKELDGNTIMSMYESDPIGTLKMSARLREWIANVSLWAASDTLSDEDRKIRIKKAAKFIHETIGFYGKFKCESPLMLSMLYEILFKSPTSYGKPRILLEFGFKDIFHDSMSHLFKLMSADAAGRLDRRLSNHSATAKAKRSSQAGWLCLYMKGLWISERMDIIMPIVQRVPYMTTLLPANARACKEISVYHTLYKLTKEKEDVR